MKALMIRFFLNEMDPAEVGDKIAEHLRNLNWDELSDSEIQDAWNNEVIGEIKTFEGDYCTLTGIPNEAVLFINMEKCNEDKGGEFEYIVRLAAGRVDGLMLHDIVGHEYPLRNHAGDCVGIMVINPEGK